jgi:hypothetical protein
VVWDVTPCRLVNSYSFSKEHNASIFTFRQSSRYSVKPIVSPSTGSGSAFEHLGPADVGRSFFRDVGNCLSVDTDFTVHHITQEASGAPL